MLAGGVMWWIHLHDTECRRPAFWARGEQRSGEQGIGQADRQRLAHGEDGLWEPGSMGKDKKSECQRQEVCLDWR